MNGDSPGALRFGSLARQRLLPVPEKVLQSAVLVARRVSLTMDILDMRVCMSTTPKHYIRVHTYILRPLRLSYGWSMNTSTETSAQMKCQATNGSAKEKAFGKALACSCTFNRRPADACRSSCKKAATVWTLDLFRGGRYYSLRTSEVLSISAPASEIRRF